MEQAVIKFLYLKGGTPKEAFGEIKDICGDDVPSYDVVKHWHTQFKCGRKSVETVRFLGAHSLSLMMPPSSQCEVLGTMYGALQKRSPKLHQTIGEACLSGGVSAYSFGAPWQTCLIMLPKHRVPVQTTECPFKITTNQTEYLPGDVISVTIRTNDDRLFMGIHIRALPVQGDQERLLGQFLTWPNNKTQAFDCFGGKQNFVTHRGSVPTSEITLTWKAPDDLVGDIVFAASFVENFTTFWSDERRYVRSKVNVTVPPAEAISPRFELVDWSECGRGKGCFLYPRTCSGYDCYAAVTYRVVNGSVHFEMFGSKHGFVSVAFSDDKEMGDDETVSCTVGDKGVNIERGYNHALFNERQLMAGLRDLQSQYVDGRLFCRFTRPMEMFLYINKGHTTKRHFDFTERHYLMLAWGPLIPGSNVISTHYELPPVTYQKVSLLETKVVRGSSLPLTKQIHGALMLVAWMLLAGTMTVLPRHFRQGLFGKTMGGVKVWFQVHRAVAISIFSVTAAGFILIFVVLKGIPAITTPHHYLGIAVMGACLLQVLSGLLRPGLDSKLRQAFNVAHWLFGKLTHIAAAVTFVYAYEQAIIPDPQRHFGYITVGVWIGHQIVWEIGLEINEKCQKRKIKSLNITNDDKMTNASPPSTSQVSNGHPALYTLYLVCLMTITAAALAAIFIF